MISSRTYVVSADDAVSDSTDVLDNVFGRDISEVLDMDEASGLCEVGTSDTSGSPDGPEW